VSQAQPDRIVLVGMMGSGKSSVGRLLAERTGWPFLDNDAMLQQLYNATPRELLEADGEAAMHSAEVTALAAALAASPPLIVAAAGGTILDPAARAEMAAQGYVVWLQTSPATAERRSAGEAHRPWPDPDRAAWIARAMVEREPLYAEVADLVLDADRTKPESLADGILKAVASRRP
jgi:shikimate kinase